MIRELFRFAPLPPGDRAPALSLTADEGTWIKVRDYEGRLKALFFFFKDGEDPETRRYLRELQSGLQTLEDSETFVAAIAALRPETLRQIRSDLALDYALLYDPFAFTARAFGVAGRLGLHCRDSVFLVDKRGEIAFSELRHPSVDGLVQLCAEEEVGEAPAPPPQEKTEAQERSETAKRAAAAQEVCVNVEPSKALEFLTEEDTLFKLVDVRTKSELDADHSGFAIHIPLDELPHRYHELEQNDYLIFICQAGGRSSSAGEFMTSIGARQIYSVSGGMSAWEGDGKDATGSSE